MHLVRDLALGLRPSMLDDFGLQPALEWLARDFTRRSNVPVALASPARSTALSDQHRTCVYRVVQEALTNCVRHARATSISVSVRARDDAIDVSVSDDGVGLDPRAPRPAASDCAASRSACASWAARLDGERRRPGRHAGASDCR